MLTRCARPFAVLVLVLVGCLELIACGEVPTPSPLALSTATVRPGSATTRATTTIASVSAPTTPALTTISTPSTPLVPTVLVRSEDNPIHSGAAMAYDASKQRITTFGGKLYEPTRYVNTTWTWDSKGWQRLQPAHFPSVRVSASLVYDAVQRHLVLFGGRGPNEETFNDTWIWDGQDWLQKRPRHVPPARNDPALVYDAAHEQVVLFGGITSNQQNQAYYLNDTWIWDGQDWTQKQVSTPPPPRFHAAIVFAPVLTSAASFNKVLLFGGYGGGSNLTNPEVLNDTWTWNGQDWHQENLPAAQKPFVDNPIGLVYDQSRKVVVLLGSNGVGGQLAKVNRVSYWDGLKWSSDPQLTYLDEQKPDYVPWNEGGQVIYDEARQAIVFFTLGTSYSSGEIWVLEAHTWRKL